MKKIISNRGQISAEFALLLAAIVAVISIVGFYYLKSISQSSTTAKTTSVKSTIEANNKVLQQVDKVKEVTTNGE
ncbi:class III signal peptide domain-containing protein, archaeosortase D/PIP-CTERM system-associated [Methanocaldococcus sp.]|uniref:class III signal peptide domain-containing protein, archaeosortase D/PIP-CTERM system-associated n=1 Tax=Methanocaldococcus sp. TaxID=2152917 RepID=UPI00262BD11E|nr:class III signal peptide domain-containing protein, archaeosortase D/PIP-CTERM system-associated [Methanocaldococcus sp.]MCQ6253957.1 class III signal peptide domain-containing protein, archaeosortase D/PIP-CTERM system-associated [Methanocaldococcus sp.]